MRRLATGAALVRGSLSVVRAVPTLLVPGAVHAVSVLAVGLAFVLSRRVDALTGTDVAALFLALLVASAVGTLSAAVVVAVTADRMAGGDARLRDGVMVARRHLPALLGWALLNATVGTVLRGLEERLGPVGRWLAAGAGVVFAIATLLVVPVLVLEGSRPVPAVRRSVRLFRERWGEAAVGDVGVGLVLLLAFLPVYVLVVCPLLAVGVVPAAVALVVVLAAHHATASTVTAVMSAGLHRVAVGGDGDGGPFGDLSALFAEKASRYTPSYAAPHGQWDAS